MHGRASPSRPFAVLTLVGAAILLAGCATTGAPTASRNEPVRVSKGMSAGQVYDLLGKPDRIEVLDDNPYAQAETWVYDRTTRETSVTQVDMSETVIYDSIRDELRTVREPVTKTVTNEIVDRTELLMVMGEVAAWKQTRVSDQDFTGN
jgi:hypothetical protein